MQAPPALFSSFGVTVVALPGPGFGPFYSEPDESSQVVCHFFFLLGKKWMHLHRLETPRKRFNNHIVENFKIQSSRRALVIFFANIYCAGFFQNEGLLQL